MTTKLAMEAYLNTAYNHGPLQRRNALCALALGGVLGTGCLLGEDNDTGQNTDGTSASGSGSATGTGTSTSPTTGTGSATDQTTETTPTTDATTSTTDNTGTTTTDPTATTGTTSTTGTTDATDTGTTGMSETGKCGWNPDKFYACDVDGGQPGVSDPDGISPIACADGLIAGEKCDGMDPVSEVGCCTPEGTLYFCDTQTDPNAPVIFQQECGV